ncbi:hypothetical protein [Halobacterium sp. R2-5]|uniref:hypothetical protein n=1 Tax=Halobacterium sp. R2-5 TaxID=2715751 RepID=UPI0014223BFE|nr:hypothetical protein [Halobacterium sp. R2-5]NIC00902.1 hypothetical protein [Halobacterium sp. R2-5]
MAADDKLVDIAEDEIGDTFNSITDLDNISDTTVLAITFLLSAQVSLSTLVLQSTALVTGPTRSIFIVLGVTTMGLIFMSINAIVKSLLPVGYYSEGVAEPLLADAWSPWAGDSAPQFETLNDRLNSQPDDETQPTYQNFAAEFVDDYGSEDSVDDYSDYQFAKLYHYKQVGKRKAHYSGTGLAWLRLAILGFVLQFGIAFVTLLIP